MAPESKQLDRVASFRDIEALKEILTVRDEAHQREHELIERANQVAYSEMNRRLDGMNHLQAQINTGAQDAKTAQAEFVTKTDWHREHDALRESMERSLKEHEKSEADKFSATDRRLSIIERNMWLASGAVALLAAFLKWLH
jgi:hypothetical protein